MPKKQFKILIVEDEPFLLELYDAKLTQEGFDAVKAGDGQAGLSLARLEMPDLILLDILMPKVDGYEMLKKLKADGKTKKIPVVIFSNLQKAQSLMKSSSLNRRIRLLMIVMLKSLKNWKKL